MGRSKGEYLSGKNAVCLSRIVNRQNVATLLSVPERCLFFAVWVLAVIYLCYSVLHASHDYVEELDNYYMGKGWNIINRQKDRFDFEWEFWSSYLHQGWPYLLIHIVIGQLFKKKFKSKKWLKYVYTCYSTLVLCKFLGVPVVLLLVVHIGIMYLCALTRSTIFTGLVSILLVSTLNSTLLVNCMKEFLLHRIEGENGQYYLMMFTIAMCNLRYTSFAMDMCWYKQKKNIRLSHQPETMQDTEVNTKSQSKVIDKKQNSKIGFSFMDQLFFVFYLPLFCTGPMLNYEQFQNQWNSPWQPWTWQNVKPLLKLYTRVIWWAVFCEIILHYMYFSSLMGNDRILSQVSLWTLAGIGYCQGQFFMVKYVVMFGIPACVACCDQIEVPNGPRCISAIYLYSDMWKYFDRGLYSFIKRYIYIPIGGSHNGLPRQFFASFCCFTFIYLWHGAEMDLFVWSLLNFIGITLEAIGNVIVTSTFFSRIEKNILGAAMSQRLKAACAVPLFAMSIIAIFTFFRSTNVGYIYFERLVLKGWPVPIMTVSFVLYCCVQTSIELNRWRKNKEKTD